MTTPTHTLYIATGTNLGDRQANLQQANLLISRTVGPIIQQSSFYETEAWGKTDQPDFLNQVLEVKTVLSPEEVLREINQIEKELGRVRREKWEPRLIDIDILFYDDLVLESEALIIPHPALQDRNFVLIPMLEIGGSWMHPLLNLTIEELYLQSKDMQEVVQLETK